MTYRFETLDQAGWDKAVASHSEANFLQSWQWGAVHQSIGDTVVRIAIYQNEKLVGALQAIVKDAKRGRYLEVPGGPLLDWTNAELVKAAATQLREIGKKHDCVFVRIRPQILDTTASRQQLQKAGLKQAPMHLHAEHTTVLDLTPSHDELLTAMRQQTRYEIRKSLKLPITVSRTNSAEAMEEFIAVQQETAQRQAFIPSSPAFLRAMRDELGDSLPLYRVESDGVLLNLAVVITADQEADYFEAASSPESRKLPGAYALLWQSIQDTKASGCSRYNFWGIAPEGSVNHRYSGVTTFKRGFGGQDTTYVPAHDLVLKPAGYLKNWLIETIRKKKRNL